MTAQTESRPPVGQVSNLARRTGTGTFFGQSRAEKCACPLPARRRENGDSPRERLPAVLLALAALLAAVPAAAQQARLIDQEPHDRITLNAANDNAVLEVFPLELPGREVPAKPRASEKLVVRLLDRPDTKYEVAFSSIAKIELFEQRIIEKALEMARAGQFEEAYDYFRFLHEQYPKTPGLAAAYEEYLFEEAKALHRQGKYDGALAVLRELHARNPKRPDLQRALGMTTEKLVEQYSAAENYESARALLRNLGALYPQDETVAKWEGQYRKEAEALQAQVKAAMEGGDLRKADQSARKMFQLWPDLPGAAELIGAVRRTYPRVVVGVTMPAAADKGDGAKVPQSGPPGASHALAPSPFSTLGDWSARRSGRLVGRLLMEFAGPGTDGGRYRSPVASLRIEELGRRLAFQVRPKVRAPDGGADLTGYGLARALLDMADPRSAAYRPGWADLVARVQVRDVYAVDVDLARTHVRPEALLAVPLAGVGGPYAVASRGDGEACYVADPRYFAAVATQPKEIVERTYAKGSLALRDLRAGRTDVLDRVAPWDLERLRGDGQIVVEPYAAPLVHVLVPNMGKPLTANRRFRRALEYGIHREAVLRHLCGGKDLPGFRVLSGPLPAGVSPDDPLGYAYDPGLKPREYDPRLALALARVAFEEVAAAEKKQGRELTEMPQLALAHPPSETARAACRVIQRQLKVAGIPAVLHEVHPAKLGEGTGAFDLAYAELAVWEPVTDAPRLLGEHGLAGACSPYMGLALAELRQAPGWREAHQVLRRIHRVAADDVALVPLWQTVEHFACRKDLRGVGTKPVVLYDNVEQWQTVSVQPEAQPAGKP